jgi:hypothetical protein
MRKRKPDNRVIGVYKHGKSGLWTIRYQENGETRSEYRKTREAAEARAKEMQTLLEHGSKTPSVTNDGECHFGTTRADWLREIWHHLREVRALTDPVLKVQAMDAMARVYKAIREDVEAIEGGTAAKKGTTDVTALSERDIEARLANIIELRSIHGNHRPATAPTDPVSVSAGKGQ